MNSIFNRNQTFQREVFLLIALLFILFFFGDLARKSAILAKHDFIRYTGLTKFIGLLLIGLLVVKRKMYNLQYVKKLVFTLVVLWSCFFMGVIALKNVSPVDVIYNDIVYTVRASFIPLMLIPFFSLEKKTAETAISVFEFMFWINAIFIVIGFIGEIKFLSTYGLTRFGYKGLFDRSSQTSFYFVFVIFYYYYLWFYKKNRKALFLFVIALLLSLLVGTKRLYFVVGIILVFHFFNAKLYKKIYTWIVLVISAAVMSLNWQTITEKLIVTFDVLYKVYKEDGLLSAIFSYRNDLLLKFINNFMEDHWSWLNYIFGGGRFHIIRTEMDYIDTYLFFGVCGPIVYFYIFKNFLFNFKPKNALILLFMIVIVIMGCFSSGIIFSANFALPLIVFMTYYYFESKHDVVANDRR